MKIIIHQSILIIFLFLLPSCEWFDNNVTPTPIDLDQKSALLVESNNQFGFSFFEVVLTAENSEKNIMVSPLSVSQALSMALNGAAGNTYAEMQNALGFVDFLPEEINQSNKGLVDALISHDPKVELSIANSMWYRNDMPPMNSFVEVNQDYYNAEVNAYDPAKAEKAKNDINNWVDNKTKGKIDEIIDQVNSDDVMFLINAVYFKAKWKTEFKKTNTEPMTFRLENGTEKQVPTMMGEVALNYYNEDKYSVIELPYGAGKFNMLIYLPEEGYTTADILPELKNTDFEMLRNMTPVDQEIWLPKFEFSYDNELTVELKALGIIDAFTPFVADFSQITDKEVFISEVNHKTYIKTDEEGSEAAAATSVTIGLTSVGPGQIIRIDKSFLFAIVEEDTHSVLFIGKVFDPTTSE
ncbi:MAG: serpin family protein [Prolixibacteraceae bacterium]|nr:serpin family protein [Prolixibacteraceae bacterium]